MNQNVMHLARHLILGLSIAFLPASGAIGQSVERDQDYMRNVVELASTLGSAHAIRVTCNGRDDQYWRGYMQRLLTLEAPYGGDLRSSMVTAFNTAFSAESSRRSYCDTATVEAEKLYATAGKRLADRLAQSNMPVLTENGLEGN